jgi:hypothetical protein
MSMTVVNKKKDKASLYIRVPVVLTIAKIVFFMLFGEKIKNLCVVKGHQDAKAHSSQAYKL